jgi:hypothetical protein
MSRVKSFEDFSSKGSRIDESIFDDILGMFGKLLPVAGEGFIRTIKQKISAAIIEKIGVKENSMLSGFVQEVVASIPVKDIPGIITGSKTNTEYLVPLLAESTQNFIQRKGLEQLLEPLGAEPNGWLVATIRNAIQGEIGKKNLEKMFTSLLGAEPFSNSVMDKFSPEEKEQLSGSLAQQAMKVYPTSVKKNLSTPSDSTQGTQKETDFEALTKMFSGLFN